MADPSPRRPQAPAPWQWRVLLAAALGVVALWPPDGGKSLATTFVNWAVDPADRLPVLPAQLPLGLGDDPERVEARDSMVRAYDALYGQGGWARRRLALKVADDPVRPAVMRPVLSAAAVVLVMIAWRIAARRR